jgi:hypothetical protein
MLRHWYISCARWIQSMPSWHSVTMKSVLTSSCHLCVSIPNWSDLLSAVPTCRSCMWCVLFVEVTRCHLHVDLFLDIPLSSYVTQSDVEWDCCHSEYYSAPVRRLFVQFMYRAQWHLRICYHLPLGSVMWCVLYLFICLFIFVFMVCVTNLHSRIAGVQIQNWTQHLPNNKPSASHCTATFDCVVGNSRTLKFFTISKPNSKWRQNGRQPNALFMAVRVGYYRVWMTQGHCTHFVHWRYTGLQVFIVFLGILFFKKMCPPQPRCVFSWPHRSLSASPKFATPT